MIFRPKQLAKILVPCLIVLGFCRTSYSDQFEFNRCWKFLRSAESGAYYPDFDDSSWDEVQIPHTARLEQLVTGANGIETRQWQGVCWYRKEFTLKQDISNKVIYLKFQGAMGTADIWLNGKLLASHTNSFLPIVVDITNEIQSGVGNLLAVRLNNYDNGLTGPKPLAHLDFNFYGGIYRDVELIIKDKLHITDPILAAKPASGGVFVTFPKVNEQRAELCIQTHIQNASKSEHYAQIRTSILNDAGETIVSSLSDAITIKPTFDDRVVQNLTLEKPKLWSPNTPSLYTIRVELLCGEDVCDSETTRVGLRDIKITKQGLWINGEKTFLRGTNRHQEYPYIGYALSQNAQYRDAKKIKEAGFDYVRLSHYPHSPAFLDACDELGLMVMNCVMGWQYYSDHESFKNFQYQQCRDLVRRDRNHPCVLLWEASLNESPMTKEFTAKMHQIVHEEYPGDQCYTCGWSGIYDVLIQARQHGGCKSITDRPCVVSEYGDWEYYAQNAGLEQEKWEDLAPEQRNSRQDRTSGEDRLLQQAYNFQEAHNDNLKTTAFADGLWVMFDYNRGYSDDLETSGCMDIFRIAKPSYYFFKSQRAAYKKDDGSYTNAFVHIANRWTDRSPLSVRVFSNCQEVALYLNEELIATKKPDTNRISTHLEHPPFTFDLAEFKPGQLRAIGFIDGEQVASHAVSTPGLSEKVELIADIAGKNLIADTNDIVFVHARIVDGHGVLVEDEQRPVSFQLNGPGEIIGLNPTLSRAGIATVLYKTGQSSGEVEITASCQGLLGAKERLSIQPKQKQGEGQCENSQRNIARSH